MIENPPLKTDENPDSHEDCRYIIPMKTVGCYILSLQVSAVPRYPLKVSKKNKVLLPLDSGNRSSGLEKFFQKLHV
jgi:hypothetical protein